MADLKMNVNVLVMFTDDQLRAECERRGVWADDDAKCTLACSRLTAERDELKAKYATACDQIHALRDECDGYNCPRTAEVERERDDWQERARAAEGVLDARIAERAEALDVASRQNALALRVIADRDEWKAAADSLADEQKLILAERDDWKRRAEAAAREVEALAVDLGRAEAALGCEVVEVMSCVCRFGTKACVSRHESGPGIDRAKQSNSSRLCGDSPQSLIGHEDGPSIRELTAKPDGERWGPSDEDLLCEDVG